MLLLLQEASHIAHKLDPLQARALEACSPLRV
jgi:hypothetical protein